MADNWEYKILREPVYNEEYDNIVDLLNNLGASGWEAVSFEHNNDRDAVAIVLKRRGLELRCQRYPLAPTPLFTDEHIQSHTCSWQSGGPGLPGMCGKKATKHRVRHSIANVGKDNFFQIDAFYCDEHAEKFDNDPPPGEKAFRDYRERRGKEMDERSAAYARDPYLGLKKTEPRREPATPPKRRRGKKEPTPICTNELIDGSSCSNPVAAKFIGKGDLYQLCEDCAEMLMIE